MIARFASPAAGARALALALLFALGGCAAPRPTTEPPIPRLAPETISFLVVDAATPEDPDLRALVDPYRAELEATMGEVVATAAFELVATGAPETPLANLTADAMLAEAERATGERFDFAVGNRGGLRIPLPEGPITLGHVFELMPFENMLVTMTLSGEQVEVLARQIVAAGGEPVAGLALHARADGTLDVRVGERPLDRAARYRVVTHDFLAFGGGNTPVLWEGREVRVLDVPLREAFLAHFRRLGTLAPALEGRIRIDP